MRILALAVAIVAANVWLGIPCSTAAYPRFGLPGPAPDKSPSAWWPVDRAAERVFREADANHDDLLSADEVRHAQPLLRTRIGELVQRGVMRAIPPTALNGQASGIKLPGQEQTSKPEFVLFARSLALHMANSNIGARGPAHGGPMRRTGVGSRSNGNHHAAPRPLDS